MRKNKSKINFRFISNWLGYCRVYYNNLKNQIFICDAEDTDILNVYCATGDKRPNSNSIDPCITYNNKKTRLYKFIMGIETTKNRIIDHINGQTGDCRKINLRVGTQLQNKANTPRGVGRIRPLGDGTYAIIFPKELMSDTSNLVFDTENNAKSELRKMQNEIFGKWSYENSQELSKQFNSHEFDNDPYVEKWLNSGILKEISDFPPNNIFRIIRDNLRALILSERISCQNEFELTQKLIYDYSASKQALQKTT